MPQVLATASGERMLTLANNDAAIDANKLSMLCRSLKSFHMCRARFTIRKHWSQMKQRADDTKNLTLQIVIIAKVPPIEHFFTLEKSSLFNTSFD